MKTKIFILSICAVLFGTVGCQNDIEDTYDFSNSIPQYVEIKSKKDIVINETSKAKIEIQSRESFQEDTDISYEVTGAFTKTGSAVLKRGTTSVAIEIEVPAGTVPVDATSATATFSLKSAKRGSVDLTVGRYGSEKEVVKLVIAKVQ